MKVIIHGPRRHLPTSVPYRTDPLGTISVEMEVPDVHEFAKLLSGGMLQTIRNVQNADLDQQEAEFCRRFDVQAPRIPRGPDKTEAAMKAEFTTAAKIHLSDDGSPVPGPGAARMDVILHRAAPGNEERAAPPTTRTNAPPDAMRDVQDGTADELRRIGSRLASLGKPYEGGMPASEAEAQALIPVLRQQIHGLEKPAAPAPTQTASAAPTMPGPPAPPRFFCSNGKAHSIPAGIDKRVHDYSVSRYGKPLCLPCQNRNQGRRT